MNSWLTLPTETKGLDLFFLSLFVAFILFAIGSFIKWIKPSESTISKDGISIKFGKKNKDKHSIKQEGIVSKNPLSLSSCLDDSPSFKTELRWVVSKSIRLGYDICKIKEVTTIKSQMNAAQVKVDLIKNMFLKDFSIKIIEYKNNNISIPNFSYEIFNEFLSRIVKTVILDEIKRLFKENHLLGYSEEEYEEVYCRDRIRNILTNFRMSINNYFPDNMNPPISDVISTLDRNETQIYSLLKESFIDAREIAYKYEKESHDRQEQFDEEILEATGLEQASRSGK